MLLRRVIIIFLFIFQLTHVVGQVNLQTGSAVFSLPMFNWQDDKSRLNSVVALNYNSGSGLKVNDVASNVGQGWNLVAGGVITRMQVGEPDDQIAYPGAGNGNDQDITKYPGGYLYGGIAAAALGCPKVLTNYPIYGARNVLYKQHNANAQDRQLDYFSFQFNGKNGMFVLDSAGGDHGVMLGDSKIKITFTRDPTMLNQGIRTTITAFTIQDVDGLIYKFTNHGLTKLLTSTFSNGDGTKQQMQPKIKDVSIYCQSAFDLGPTASPWKNNYMAYPYLISSWYLSEIDDPFTSRKITFSYNTLTLTNSAGTDISYNSGSNRYVVISYKKSITTAMELTTIAYPDGHTANFNYSTTSRFDFPGEHSISTVYFMYQGRYLSQYLLNTSYFILNRYGNPTSAYEKSVARLCLTSVKKIGVDLKEDTPPYIFDYYTSTGSGSSDDFVPPPFSYVKDVWGYYNGNNSIKSNSPLTTGKIPINSLTAVNPYQLDYYSLKGLCFLNDNIPAMGLNYNANPGYAANGLLKMIIYPTGGSLTYKYAQNTGTFINSGTVMNVGGVHVSQTSSADGGYSNGCATPITTQYSYVVNGTGSASSLWGLETPQTSIVSNNNWEEEFETWHFTVFNPFGSCLWHYVYPGILSQYEAVSLDEFQKIMNAIAPVLGVLSVISDVMDVINVSLDATPLAIVAVVLDVISAVLGYILSCPRASKYTAATIYYDFDLNSASPLPAQFKRVEITESSGAIGKTVEQFTNGDDSDPNEDYPVWFGINTNPSLSTKQRFAPWAYGLPKLITQYDVNGNKIKERQNVYDYSRAQFPISDLTSGVCGGKNGMYAPLQSCKCEVNHSYSERGDNWTSNPTTYLTSSSSDMNVDTYQMYTGHVNLSNTYERTYRTTDATQFVQTETDYYYNIGDQCSLKGNYEVNSTVSTQSNGDVVYYNVKYSTDYNTGMLANLVNNNLVAIPVETNTYITKYLGPIQYVSEKVTEFSQITNGDIRPYRIIEQRFATPPTTLIGYSGPTTTNYSIYKIPQQFTYDVNSNLVGVKDEGSRVVTNIYDYNDKFIVASVVNADPSFDKSAYTSFESQDLSRSGWVLTGTASYASNNLSPTGANIFTMMASGTNSLTASSLNSSKAYTLSFWASSGSLSVTGGASLVKSAPTYSGFTYYEYSIVQGTASVIVKNNSASNISIDELRLYPSNARMRTTTYDPLIGKTSECDENNRITYYTYDNLGRMRFVEDEARNVIKMYEYNNISAAKQTGCPGTYTNNLLSELFARSNCGAGYQGSSVSVAVTAGTYHSSISQFDADIQAEIYLLTNGQNNANTAGTCSLIYYNTVQSETDTTQSCSPGYAGGPVTYTVPAGTYSSIISQADANQQALDDIAANAMAYVNLPSNANCAITTTPDWEWTVGDSTIAPGPSYCLSVNGQLPPHFFVLATDVNPNSPTYNQTQWEDTGPSSYCAANTYYNASQAVAFTRNNCTGGLVGTSVTYTVPAGKYNSTSSQAAADLQATNDVNANGQNYANTNGQCLVIENVTYTDSRTFQYSVRFTNNSSGNIYNFTANANSSGTLGQVPSGVYTVYICPINNYTPNNNYTVQGITQTSVVCATFNNVSVTSTATLRFY